MSIATSTRHLLLLTATLLLTACGSAPSIKNSTLLDRTASKTQRLNFVYLQTEMQLVSSRSFGGGATPADTGFSGFGEVVAKQAGTTFEKLGVAVLSAKVQQGKQGTQPVIADESQTAPTLLLAPVSGKIESNNRATNVSYVFTAILLNPATRRPIWRATIDTSTWSGQDIVLKHASKTLYDEAYAQQLLTILGKQMQQDGAI